MRTCESCGEEHVITATCSTCPSQICELCCIGADLQCRRCVVAGRTYERPVNAAGLCICTTCSNHNAALIADLQQHTIAGQRLPRLGVGE